MSGATPDRTVDDRSTYDGAADGFESYALALKCQRERGIRSGAIAPLPERPHEVRWAQEGPRPTNRLDTVTGT